MSAEWKQYWTLFFKKILENLASVKVWFFILPFIVSSLYLGWIIFSHLLFIKMTLTAILGTKTELIDPILTQMKTITEAFAAWCTFNISLAGTVIVVRETFKVSKLKAVNEANKNGNGNGTAAKDEIAKVNI